MGTSYFNPHAAQRPCWWCEHYGVMVYGGSAARCRLPGAPIRAQPQNGCAFYQREVGADDELGPPAGGGCTLGA